MVGKQHLEIKIKNLVQKKIKIINGIVIDKTKDILRVSI